MSQTLHDKLAGSHPSLTRGQVWCRSCGHTQRVDSAGAMARGWPKCCQATMTIDAPADQWVGVARGPLYEVNALGAVRRATGGVGSRPGLVLRPAVDRRGYLYVTLYDGAGRRSTQRVHVLVAEGFIGPAPPGKQVNHKDLNKANPQLENLEYLTPSENLTHSYRGRQIPGRRGEESGRAKLTEVSVRAIRAALTAKPDRFELGLKFGVSKTTIDRIATGRTWAWLPMTIDSPEEQLRLSAARQ